MLETKKNKIIKHAESLKPRVKYTLRNRIKIRVEL